MRVIQGSKQREYQRKVITNLTPQQLFNDMRHSHNHPPRPHRLLSHQFQHLNSRLYNDLEQLTDRKVYPLSYVFAYEPLRSNQMEEEAKRSRSIS
jgi:hypothetical protein